MEQTRPQAAITAHWPLLVKGEVSWKDYTLEATVRPLSTRSHTGIVFRYQHGRRYYFLGFEGGELKLLKRDQDQLVTLSAKTFEYDVDHEYRLKVECIGNRITASVNDTVVLEIEDDSYDGGKIGLSSRMPAQYADIQVTMTEEHHAAWIAACRDTELELAKLRTEYPLT